MSTGKLLSRVAEVESLAPLDLRFAELLSRLAKTESEGDLLAITAGLVSKLRSRGHSCLHLDRWAGRILTKPGLHKPILDKPSLDQPGAGSGTAEGRLPSRDAWRSVLERSALVAVSPSLDSAPRPLVLDGRDRIYLWRYWRAEQVLASDLKSRLAEGSTTPKELERVAPLFRRLFTDAASDGPLDWQAVAAAAALSRSFTLISGGPGTGKTTTVTRILALLAELDPDARIALAAPTGKAATRLEESIAEQLTRLPVDPEVRGRIPRKASTLHRLLGYSPRTDRFRFGADLPLSVDVLVVDEASMVDLLMMVSLLVALPPTARLILLGDRDQLASVDTGFVFGDLTTAAGLARNRTARLPPRLAPAFRILSGRQETPTAESEVAPESPAEAARADDSPLAGAAVELQISYRFRSRKGIGSLATAIRSGDDRGALQALEDPSLTDVHLHPLPSRTKAGQILSHVEEQLEACMSASGPEQALERLGAFRILAATRVGPWGTQRLNRLVESFLESRGFNTLERFYAGQPVLIESNDYSTRLFNGDLGMIWPHEGGLWAYFPEEQVGGGSPAGPGAGSLRRLPLAKLPPFSTAWSMTVHKSQGSELDQVLLVLPAKELGDLLSRELLYTGVTRARERVDLVAPVSILESAIRKTSRRSSGLVEALRPV